MEDKFYIAYGSNLNLSHMQNCCPGARPVGISEILDYELLFKGDRSGNYLTIEPKRGGMVPVVVWKLARGDERRLDVYEGYPSLYYKKNIDLPMTSLSTGNIIRVHTFVYIMYEDQPPGAPSKYYYDTCVEGYHSFGFQLRFLERALSRTHELIQKQQQQKNGDPGSHSGKTRTPFQHFDKDAYF